MSNFALNYTYKTEEKTLGFSKNTNQIRTNNKSIDIKTIEGRENKVWNYSLSVNANEFLILINTKGSCIIRHGKSTNLIPEKSILFVHGPINMELQVSRGKYQFHLLTWDAFLTMGLKNWLNNSSTEGIKILNNVFACSCISKELSSIYKTIVMLLDKNESNSRTLLLGFLHQIAVYAVIGKGKLALANIPEAIPDYMKKLLLEVKKDPSKNWCLNKGAEFVGYSSYHLSRSFRTVMKYGFPEFVDRCRIEQAINKLCEGIPIEQVASICGYCSAHVFRESLKKYTGFLPSEIRNISYC